jgi:large subunit ribosomal protein L3
MIQTLIGIKKDMTSSYDSRGRRVGVTKIQVTPNFVTQVKTTEKDGYNAVQIGAASKKSVLKPQRGHFKKAGAPETLRFVQEIRVESTEESTLGQELKVGAIFKVGDIVKLTGTSKGKGFQGGVRRHGFHGGPKTHGQSDRHRAPGSIGSGTTPGRVYKGKKMAGHMGSVTSTIRNVEIIEVDKKNNILVVKGNVPGFNGTEIRITKLGVVKGYTPPPEPEVEEEFPSDVEQMAGVTEEQAHESVPAEEVVEAVEAAEEGAPVEAPTEEVETEKVADEGETK